MKLKIAYFFFSLIVSLSANAQVYQATYKADYSPRLDRLGTKKIEKTFLIIEKSSEGVNSLFISENFMKYDSLMQLAGVGKFNLQNAMAEPNFPRTNLKYFVQKDIINKKNTVNHLVAIDVFRYEQNQTFNWKLENDTLTVSGFLCQKATTSFEGREFTAWFTKELPFYDGPHKFCGLPGLIVQVYDTENHYKFTLEGFQQFASKKNYRPYLGTNSKKVSYQQFQKILREFIENPLKPLIEAGIEPINDNPVKENLPKFNLIERF